MAFRTLRFLGFIALRNGTRYPSHQLPSSSLCCSFSNLDCSEYPEHSLDRGESNNSVRIQSNLDERSVLDELSDLLSLNPKTSSYSRLTENAFEKPMGTRAADGFLSSEEKLRGVFLQKLKGKSAIESALAATGVVLTVEIVAGVVNRGNLGGEAMVTFFRWAIKQPTIPNDVKTYHIILKALGRRKFFHFMAEILNEMRKEGINPGSETLSIVMDSYIRAHHISKALHIFRTLETLGLRCDTESFNVLLQCLCQRSHVGTACSLFNAMKGKICFNFVTYNLIISGWSKIGRVKEIERTLEAMVADGFNPNCSSFGYLVECLGRAGQINDAVEVFDRMEQRGCVPDTVNYNAMISNFISVGDLDESMKYYHKMLVNSCAPDVDTYSKLIGALLRARRVADALEMFDEMLGRGIVPSTGKVTSFIRPLCNYGPPHAAMMIYKKARKVGCKISLKAYKLLLMRLSRFGKCGMILKLWDEMQEIGHSSDMEVYEYVINGLCNVGQLDNAVLVMEEALCKGFCPGKLIYSKLNNKLLNVNKVEMAYKLFLKVKTARRSKNARIYWRANGWHF